VQTGVEVLRRRDESEVVGTRVAQRCGGGDLAIPVAAKAKAETGGEFGSGDSWHLSILYSALRVIARAAG
jgi:hypothetical protein